MAETNLLDERQLIADYGRGDPTAVRTVDGWIDAALRMEFQSLRGEWDDLRQEVRARLVQNLRLERFAVQSSFRTYVHRITRYVSIDLKRRARHRREEPIEGDALPPAAIASDGGLRAHLARDLVDKIFGRLAEGDRLLMEMVFGESCSYAEIARRLGVTEAAVKTRVFRCKNRILEHHARLTRGGR